MTGTPRRIVVDTDGGVDDLVALAWLLRLPDVEIPAIIATGGARPADVVGAAVTHALRALAPARRPLLLRGAEIDPAARAAVPSGARLHGEYGLGPFVPAHGVEFDGDVRVDPSLPAHTDYLVLGPLTTAERLAGQVSHWPAHVRLTVMGGAFSLPGVVRGAEPNFARDPRAARQLFAEPPGRGVRVVPTDATTRASCPPEAVRRVLAGGDGWPGVRAQLLAHYWSGTAGRSCHDLVAAAVVARPEVVAVETPATVGVDAYGRSDMTPEGNSAVTVVSRLDDTAWREIVLAWATDREATVR
ncbi:nucleoside hydrolase [Micromonospora sp. NPDC052213]|uniref:nucleoside hydrolase n=1 Tax=Micromonospora sp. NPDC052213 TaxID=3155812 RepID=UPI003428FA73